MPRSSRSTCSTRPNRFDVLPNELFYEILLYLKPLIFIPNEEFYHFQQLKYVAKRWQEFYIRIFNMYAPRYRIVEERNEYSFLPPKTYNYPYQLKFSVKTRKYSIRVNFVDNTWSRRKLFSFNYRRSYPFKFFRRESRGVLLLFPVANLPNYGKSDCFNCAQFTYCVKFNRYYPHQQECKYRNKCVS